MLDRLQAAVVCLPQWPLQRKRTGRLLFQLNLLYGASTEPPIEEPSATPCHCDSCFFLGRHSNQQILVLFVPVSVVDVL